jgi:hypothetical protein
MALSESSSVSPDSSVSREGSVVRAVAFPDVMAMKAAGMTSSDMKEVILEYYRMTGRYENWLVERSDTPGSILGCGPRPERSALPSEEGFFREVMHRFGDPVGRGKSGTCYAVVGQPTVETGSFLSGSESSSSRGEGKIRRRRVRRGRRGKRSTANEGSSLSRDTVAATVSHVLDDISDVSALVGVQRAGSCLEEDGYSYTRLLAPGAVERVVARCGRRPSLRGLLSQGVRSFRPVRTLMRMPVSVTEAGGVVGGGRRAPGAVDTFFTTLVRSIPTCELGKDWRESIRGMSPCGVPGVSRQSFWVA